MFVIQGDADRWPCRRTRSIIVTIAYNVSARVNAGCGIDEVPMLLAGNALVIVFENSEPAVAEYRGVIADRAGIAPSFIMATGRNPSGSAIALNRIA